MIRQLDGWHIGRWYRGGEKRGTYRAAPGGLTARCESTRGAGLFELKDISTGGAQLATHIPVGTRLLIELHLPDGGVVRTAGTVVRRIRDESVGISFDGLYEEQQELIQGLVHEYIAAKHSH